MNRKIVLVSLLSFVLIIGSTCAVFGAPQKLDLVIYGATPPDMAESEFDQFHKWARENYDVEIDLDYIQASTVNNYERAKAERNNPQADILFSTMGYTLRGAEKGLFEPYLVDNFHDYPKFARDNNALWYGHKVFPYVFIYNNELLSKQEVPDTWPEIISEKWEDKLHIRDFAESGTAGSIEASILGAYGPEQGKDYLYRLDARVNGKYTGASAKTVFDVARGVKPLSIWNEAFSLHVMYNKDFETLSIKYPKDWMTAGLETRQILRGAPHRRAAEIFMEWTTSEALANYHAESYGRPVLDVENPPEWLEEAPTSELPLLGIDWAKIAEVKGEWIRVWDEKIKGQGNQYVEETPQVPEYTVIDEYLQ